MDDLGDMTCKNLMCEKDLIKNNYKLRNHYSTCQQDEYIVPENVHIKGIFNSNIMYKALTIIDSTMLTICNIYYKDKARYAHQNTATQHDSYDRP